MTVITQNELRDMSEADLRRRVIMPLMEKMGYRGVHEWHSAVGELGKDLLGWKEGDFGIRINLAVVAKADRISGSTVKEVGRQVRQAFNTPFQDPITFEEQQVHRVWVVTNKEVPTDSLPGLWSDVDVDKKRHVEIIDGDELWRAWKEHFPVELFQALEEAQRHLRHLDTGLRTRVWLEPEARGVEVSERYPGQLESDPVLGKMSFQFPNTPEGRAKAEELRASWATGSTASIPGEYVNQFVFEEVDRLSERLFGIKFDEITNLEISSVQNPKPTPVRIEIQADDGDQMALDYVEWQVVQAGSEELTLTNESQPIPIRVKHVIKLGPRTADFNFTLKEGPVAAVWWLRWLQLQSCFGKPCSVRVTLVETETKLLTGRREGQSTPDYDPRWIEVVSELAKAQEKIGQPILIPESEFSEEEMGVVGKIRSLLRNPKVGGTWNNIEITMSVKDAESQLQRFFHGQQGPLHLRREERATLAGTEFSLGHILHEFESARLANEPEVHEQISSAENKEVEIRARFEPGDSNRAAMTYLDWIGEPEQSVDQLVVNLPTG